jgi:hypothetical protein
MKTIEEKAKEYGGGLTITRETQKTVTREDFEQAFLAGARAVQEWIPCSRPPKDHQVVLLKLGGEMGEEQSWGIISVTAYRESGKWYYALFGEEIDAHYKLKDWRPIECK